MVFDSTTCFGKVNSGKPLKTYSTESEAVEVAEYALQHYDNELVPYKCDRCEYWHLSPKDRITVKLNKPCGCTDEKGSPKALYLSEKDAEKRAKIIFNEEGKKLRVYKCPYSNGWHLTHKSIGEYL
ncbi:MAG: hypothetical protein ACTTIZ_05205 [Treponema sp.]